MPSPDYALLGGPQWRRYGEKFDEGDDDSERTTIVASAFSSDCGFAGVLMEMIPIPPQCPEAHNGTPLRGTYIDSLEAHE